MLSVVELAGSIRVTARRKWSVTEAAQYAGGGVRQLVSRWGCGRGAPQGGSAGL